MEDSEVKDDWFEKQVRKNRVFILGAGFSASAGVPLTSSLLDLSMAKFSIECDGIFSRVDSYAQESINCTNNAVDYKSIRCQPWRAKRRLVVPGSREAALLTRRARSAPEGKQSRHPNTASSHLGS